MLNQNADIPRYEVFGCDPKKGIKVGKIVVLLCVAVLGIGCATSKIRRSMPDARATTVRPVQSCAIDPQDDVTVRQLVDMLRGNNLHRVQFAFDNLLFCAPSIQASLVRHMNDRAPIVVGPLYVLNSMPRFELFALYVPQQVIDAIAIILGDPGAEPVCSSLIDGGTDEQRAKCVSAWKMKRCASMIATLPDTSLPVPIGAVRPTPMGCLDMVFYSPSDASAYERDTTGRISNVITSIKRHEPLLEQWTLNIFEEAICSDDNSQSYIRYLPGVETWEFVKKYLQPKDEIWTFGVLDTGFVIIRQDKVLVLVVTDHAL